MSDYPSHAMWIRRRILELGLIAGANGSHQGSAMSVVDILTVLYGKVLNINKESLRSPERDRFILSKGHAAVALYAILQSEGYLTPEQTDSFESNGTEFYAHAHRDLSRAIEFSGGSLGLGLSYGVGVALACKRAGFQNRIFVLVGDGECDEGLLWESCMAAANFGLSNLVLIVDCNGMQSDGKKADIMNHFSLCDKLTAFGFDTKEIDGHDYAAIEKALTHPNHSCPVAVVANTVKGKGVAFMEGNPDWHHGVLTKDLFNKAVEQFSDSTPCQ
jgi:transketolase